MSVSLPKTNHSTKIAVLFAFSGLFTKADEKLVSKLALLDLGAAFDALDHEILLKKDSRLLPELGAQLSTVSGPTCTAVNSQLL